MTLPIKACLVIIKDCADLFLVNLNIYILYKEEEALILPASLDRSFLSFSTPKSNNYACDKFISTVVKNEIVYIMAAEIKKI